MKSVGEPIPRRDGRDKVTGAAKYSYEWAIANCAYGVIVTSPIAKGRVLAVEAEKEPGILAILTPGNAPLPGDPKPADSGDRVVQVLQDDRILYSNQPVAVVVGETFEAAMHTALRAKVRVEAEKHTVRMEDELANAFPHDIQSAGGKQPADQTRGSPARGLAGAATVVDTLYETPPETHNPLEPHATLAVWDSPQHLTVYDATQGITGVQKKLAKCFALPKENVRVVTKFVGGGFGCKGGVWSHVVLAALAARIVGRPVKIALTRQQMFGPVGGRPHTRQKLTAAADAHGKLTLLRHESTSTTSQFDDFLEPAALVSRHQYKCENVETKHRLVRLDIGTPTYMRAPGESSGSFALESAIDELAHQLGMDPLQLRLVNYAELDPTEGKPFSSKSLRTCYEMGAARFGWKHRPPRSVQRDGRLFGIGVATASYPANQGKAAAVVKRLADGTYLVQSGAVDIGTGTYTAMAQVAADALGVPVEKVRFDLGDTLMPEAPRSGGSQTAASVSSAVEAACRKLRSEGSNEATAEVKPSEERKQYSLHSFGAQFAEVSVDAELGMVYVERIVGAFAAGRILNARLARSQFMGGIVWGIGMALHEHTVYDARLGRIMSKDLADYHVPANYDVGVIDPIFLEDENDAHVDPAGVKGIGEIGITGTAAAIANAVFNATGKRIRTLPITPDKLL